MSGKRVAAILICAFLGSTQSLVAENYPANDPRAVVASLLPASPNSESAGATLGNHTFRATGITAYLANGDALEHAQEMAAQESPRMTKLYDRTKERLTQDEIERIRL